MNLAELVRRQAELRPTAAAIVESSRALSYRDFDRLVDRAAADLIPAGVGEGDRTGLCVKVPRRILVCESLPKTASGKARNPDLEVLLHSR